MTVMNFLLPEITDTLTKATIKTGVPSFQLLQQQFTEISFSENLDQKPQAQSFDVLLENKPHSSNGNSISSIRQTDFQEKTLEVQHNRKP